MHNHILSIILFTPLAGAILLLFVPHENKKAVRLIANIFALAGLLVSLPLVPWFWAQRFEPGFKFIEGARNNWIPSIGAGYYLGIDGISFLLIMLTTLLGWISILSSWSAIEERTKEYYAWFLVLHTGMLGVFIALVFFLYTLLGSVLMLLGILFLYFNNHSVTGIYTFSIPELYKTAPAIPFHFAIWLFLAFFVGFAIKVPMFPFHTWLPDAHVEAPTAGSVILASIMLKLGTYGFIRLAIPLFPAAAMSPGMRTGIIILAVIGVIYGSLVAMVQPDFKKLVAYSSVAHLGMVMLGLFALTRESVQGAMMVMIGHGLSTGALFLLIGMIYERKHSREIAAYGGLARVIPLFSLILVVSALASIGLPGLNGFVGEFLVLLGSFERYPWATGIATTGVIFAAAYLLWALQRILFNKLDKPENAGLKDLTARELWVVLPLVAGMIWLGLYPKPVLDRMT